MGSWTSSAAPEAARGADARAERHLLLAALLLLPIAERLLHLLGFRRLYTWLDRTLPAPGPAPAGQARQRGSRLAPLVDRAARRAPGAPGCLPRAFVLWTLLRCERLPSRLRFGVRRRGESVEAHAWVLCGEHALDPAPEAWLALPPLEPALAPDPETTP